MRPPSAERCNGDLRPDAGRFAHGDEDRSVGARFSAVFDIGIAPQVAQIAPRQRGDLLVEQLLFDLPRATAL